MASRWETPPGIEGICYAPRLYVKSSHGHNTWEAKPILRHLAEGWAVRKRTCVRIAGITLSVCCVNMRSPNLLTLRGRFRGCRLRRSVRPRCQQQEQNQEDYQGGNALELVGLVWLLRHWGAFRLLEPRAP